MFAPGRLEVVAVLVCAGAVVGCGSVSGGTGADAAGAAGTGGGAAGTGGGAAGTGGGAAGTGGDAAGTGGSSGTGGVAGMGGGSQDADTGDVPTPMDADTRKCTVKINEVQTGGAGDGGALDEFIELYNTCPDRAFNLAGYNLVYRSATGTTDNPRVMFTTQTIAAGKPYYVCANSSFVGTPDIRYTSGLATDGALALRSPDGNVVDAVGWGAATNAIIETAPAPAPMPSQSIARVPDGHDSDDNSHDFMIATTPTPGAAN